MGWQTGRSTILPVSSERGKQATKSMANMGPEGDSESGHFIYEPGFLSETQAEELIAFFRQVPVRAPADQDLRHEFSFAQAQWEGKDVPGRKLAAAGDPIWLEGGPATGVTIPGPLASLRDEVSNRLQTMRLENLPALAGQSVLPLTSVYVDWYSAGGYLGPHVDRDCYGPVIAGVSVGTSTAVMRFFCEGHGANGAHEFELSPNSLYVFCGPIRHSPWQHEVLGGALERFGITFRSRYLAGAPRD